MTVVQPGYFVVWVTCLIQGYEDKIVAGMVKKDYTVSLSNTKGVTVGEPNHASVVVSFSVFTKNEKAKANDVYSDLIKVLEEHKIYYYSVVVSAMTDSTWTCGNMVINKPTPPPVPETPRPEPDKNLN